MWSLRLIFECIGPDSLANAEDMKEITRKINECVSSNVAEEYIKAHYPKHCLPCFLIDKHGGSGRLLVVHYGELDRLTKRHSKNPSQPQKGTRQTFTMSVQEQAGQAKHALERLAAAESRGRVGAFCSERQMEGNDLWPFKWPYHVPEAH